MTAFTLIPTASYASRLVRMVRSAGQRSIEISATRVITPRPSESPDSVGDTVADALTWFSNEGRRNRA